MKQRPLQTILKRKPLPKDPPAKPESKAVPIENKANKGSIKSSAAPDSNSSGLTRRPEVKKQEEEKKVVPPAPVEPVQGGHYELNTRMTKMVENELRDIMIKVWQELPDNPTDPSEALVVDKLRNKAGDDLRNVLGLNITKRLLNVHNPLFVKVQFSGKPEKAHLAEFLKKYNFTAFKRIEKTVNMFAAQVKTINDFDRVCSDKDIRCGEIKVTVSPIYKFTKCPPNLVTSFYGQDEDEDETTTEINEKDKAELTSETKTPEKVTNKQNENVPQKPKPEPSKVENVTKAENNVNKTVDNKAANNKPAVEKPANKSVLQNKVVAKPTTENKPAITKQAAENKSAVTKPAAENKATPTKATPEKPTNKAPVEIKTVDSKPSLENKTINKPVVNKTTVAKAAVTSNGAKQPTVENKQAKIAQTTNNDSVKKPNPSPTKAVQQTKGTKKSNKNENDNDELDDHDILALISEGIVLDECSGSDDE